MLGAPLHAASTAHVLALWAAVALLSLLEALLFPVVGPAGVAANVFVFLAALAVLSHVVGRRPAAAPVLAIGFKHYVLVPPPAAPLAAPLAAPHAQTQLLHIFLHVLCAAYVRAACWFELRALLA